MRRGHPSGWTWAKVQQPIELDMSDEGSGKAKHKAGVRNGLLGVCNRLDTSSEIYNEILGESEVAESLVLGEEEETCLTDGGGQGMEGDCRHGW